MRIVHKKKIEETVPRKKTAAHPVKTTSLAYLDEALQEEHYEACSEIIRIAAEFGAAPEEIEGVLANYSRRDRSALPPAPQWLAGFEPW